MHDFIRKKERKYVLGRV